MTPSTSPANARVQSSVTGGMLTISIGYRQPDSLSPSLRLRDVYGVSFSLATTSHADTFDKTFAMRAHAIGENVAEQLATQRRIAWTRRLTT